MYSKLPNLVIGFHGCNKKTFNSVIKEGGYLRKSENTYDWLGHGIYFWEQNLERARDWAKRRYKDDAEVIGAVLDLGYCLNLTDSASAKYLEQGYRLLKARCETIGTDLPVNRSSKKTEDILLRDLDCSVIQQIQDYYSNTPSMPAFDSVRGVFIEGDPAYPGAAIKSKTHIQLCICNPNCIKGYFAPRKDSSKYRMP